MRNTYSFLILSFLILTASLANAAVVPSINLKNQQGEISKNYVVGGSSQISVKFVVDTSNANGVRSMTAYGGADAPSAVYMNTAVTPSSGNPNPSPGYIIVKFAKGYTSYVLNSASFGSPPSGSLVNVTAGLQQGKPYVIQTVGTTTAAQWQFLGLPSNLTPTVSQSFISVTGSAGTGTGVVAPPMASGSGAYRVEFIGSPTLNANTTNGTGGQFLFQILGPVSSAITTLTPKAPSNNSVIELQFVMTPQPGSPL